MWILLVRHILDSRITLRTTYVKHFQFDVACNINTRIVQLAATFGIVALVLLQT